MRANQRAKEILFCRLGGKRVNVGDGVTIVPLSDEWLADVLYNIEDALSNGADCEWCGKLFPHTAELEAHKRFCTQMPE